jgi:hypothetical protein
MSSISFETKNGTVKVSGSERAALSILLEQFTMAFLQPVSNHDLLVTAVPSSHYLAEPYGSYLSWSRDFQASFHCEDRILSIDGKTFNGFDMILNTALEAGSDSMKLAAAIHGQCEINAFVRGKNRAWMADIIERDNANIFRPGRGWEDVIKLLRESGEDTVFMSYSVTGSIIGNLFDHWFKDTIEERNLDATDWEVYSLLENEWEAMGEVKHWELAEEWADDMQPYGFEISPERFASDFVFGDGMNAGKFIGSLERKHEEEQAKNAKVNS